MKTLNLSINLPDSLVPAVAKVLADQNLRSDIASKYSKETLESAALQALEDFKVEGVEDVDIVMFLTLRALRLLESGRSAYLH